MIGAIIGDVVGSVYEFNNIKTTEFPLFSEGCMYTDDTILSIAVAKWLLCDDTRSTDSLTQCLVELALENKYPKGGYGGGFRTWAFNPKQLRNYATGTYDGRVPYYSFGNGSAMRVSACGWVAKSIEEAMDLGKLSASVTHNHPEGIKGAEATSVAIYMGRSGASKQQIKDFIESEFGYDLHRTCDSIRPEYKFESSCQKTVPEAIVAFLDSTDFESALRLAISLGGDSDTLTCITGGIAEAFYKDIPKNMIDYVLSLLPQKYIDIINRIKIISAY